MLSVCSLRCVTVCMAGQGGRRECRNETKQCCLYQTHASVTKDTPHSTDLKGPENTHTGVLELFCLIGLVPNSAVRCSFDRDYLGSQDYTYRTNLKGASRPSQTGASELTERWHQSWSQLTVSCQLIINNIWNMLDVFPSENCLTQWHNICVLQNQSGLGVKRMDDVNTELLKW